jgi:hypothetical protein
VASNRELAAQLLQAADLWVFVTTAARYADAVPWDLLRTAQERGTALAVVLDRVPPEAVAEVATTWPGCSSAPASPGARLFVVEERPLLAGRLPDDQVAPLRSWLHGLAADAGQRAAVVRQTLDGALRASTAACRCWPAPSSARRTPRRPARRRRRRVPHRARRRRRRRAQRHAAAGEVLAPLAGLRGTGEWMRSLESRIGRARDRSPPMVTGRPTPAEDLQGALEVAGRAAAAVAADRAAERTRHRPGGRRRRQRAASASASRSWRARRPASATPPRRGARLAGLRARPRAQRGRGQAVDGRVLSFGVNGAGLA